MIKSDNLTSGQGVLFVRRIITSKVNDKLGAGDPAGGNQGAGGYLLPTSLIATFSLPCVEIRGQRGLAIGSAQEAILQLKV